ncbi:hypothetical protein QBC32DRAFT_57073 [Pseudoneurospora amorphoporcata]|uniref:DUF2293 domain-containing protein n=1 Tax=Pseudoneurospora amorphoporcata TaxID=241081 RepID=A0AAN6P749_9PEZI|nr:hypothetical protein QBC32DRAFT_57073 [Pseudoneurospora amorphoporcata]
MAGDEHEPEARFHDSMPIGYVFVPKGDVYITKHCRRETHSANLTVYVVVNNRRKPIGLRCPASIVEAVQESNQATAAKRAEAVQKRDAAIEGDFKEALKRLFPNTPEESIPKLVSHALKKRSRRVGRSGTVQLDDKVKLAVRAHIRHQHTDYEQLLRQGTTREEARKQVFSKLNEVARLWGGRPAKSAGTKRKAEDDDGNETRITRERSKLLKRQKKEERVKMAATGANIAPLKKTKKVERKKARKKMTREQTRRMAREGIEPVGGAEEEPIIIDDSDGQEAVFTRDEDTDFDDGNESDWSNWSDISFGNATGKKSQQNDHHWTKPCRN